MFRVSSDHVVKFIKSYTVLSELSRADRRRHGSCLPLLLTFHCVTAVHPSRLLSFNVKTRYIPFLWLQYTVKKLWSTGAFFAARRVLYRNTIDSRQVQVQRLVFRPYSMFTESYDCFCQLGCDTVQSSPEKKTYA